MSRLALAAALPMWVGSTLLLSTVRTLRRPALVDRVAPYAPDGPLPRRRGLLSVEGYRDVLVPIATAAGSRVAQVVGVGEDLGTRLRRIHAPDDVAAFRLRQLGWATVGFAGGGLLAVAGRLPVVVGVALVAGGPVLAFLVLEQRVASASDAYQRRLFLELPVVTEQLAMLLGAGYSVGAALNRLAARGDGACAEDVRHVVARVRQGLSEAGALKEWALLARVPALDRLVAVLALDREASDVGRLVSEEARSIRRDVQRRLIETMERRQQQVWIPVTVAALVPGVIFLSIPFIEALRLFSGS